MEPVYKPGPKEKPRTFEENGRIDAREFSDDPRIQELFFRSLMNRPDNKERLNRPDILPLNEEEETELASYTKSKTPPISKQLD